MGGVHVSWIWNIPFGGNIDAYYSRSDDDGATWLDESPRVNDVPYSVQPYVAWTTDLLADDLGRAYVFWNDGRENQYYDNIYTSHSGDAAGVEELPGDPALGAQIPGGAGRWSLVGHPGRSPEVLFQLDRTVSGLYLDVLQIGGRRLGSIDLGILPRGQRRVALRGLPGLDRAASGMYLLRVVGPAGASRQRSVWIR
ncbi:MAG: hypothetical protein GF355_00410 [Candidatus Eisenbacteria bacterium]|nr:hypothetical protein [Candidatus Eisenbacteria bacterium]